MVTLPSHRRIATPEELAYATHFGIAPALATLLAELQHAKPGRCISAWRTQICKLRLAMEPESIDTTTSGYCLTEVGRAECEAAIEAFQAWIREAV